MDANLDQELRDAELSIAGAEKEFGPEHPEVAERLSKYAALLRQTERRKLDAVNVEARAKAIRAKLYAAEAASENAKPSVVIVKPKLDTAPSPGVYLGLAGLLAALCSLMIDQSYFQVIAPLALVLAVADLITTRGGGWWRALLTMVLLGCSWGSIQALPPNMLTDATPLERLTYATENATLVNDVKNLEQPISVMNYEVALPANYQRAREEEKDWGNVYEWRSPIREDQTYSQFVVLRIRPEDTKKFARTPVTRLAKDLAMPRVLAEVGLEDADQDLPKLDELNGFDYTNIGFRGRTDDRPRRGFAYIFKERNALVALVGLDWSPNSEETLRPLEASVYTFSPATLKNR